MQTVAGETRLTLQAIDGLSTCIRTVPEACSHLCNGTYRMNLDNDKYLLLPTNAWWVCTAEFIPCAHGVILHQRKEFSVLVQLLHRIIYHKNDQVLDFLDGA